MKLRNLRNESQPKLMIIPMIDIIFFLLVFFMMSTLYMVERRSLPVALPQAATAAADTGEKVIVTVTENGQIQFGEEVIPMELLQRRTKQEIVRRQGNMVILLQADRNLPYGQVVAVLDMLKSAGAQRVVVAVEKAGAGG
ncbi:ExbD/TolR family protein [Propionispora vibrioides]|uniref:Biopolymer transport protein ExbD n=1 Tax=Propionispora vibrioides TaxID=112903 RepID=A0A1H8X665_9FIRM|nr:biopolymer transporter ExbD [Propionispora vibrioides]SEP35203.1 biopolymer transport protein ExbD [Propionispora vibrioides]